MNKESMSHVEQLMKKSKGSGGLTLIPSVRDPHFAWEGSGFFAAHFGIWPATTEKHSHTLLCYALSKRDLSFGLEKIFLPLWIFS